MNGRKDLKATVLWVVAVGIISVSVTAVLLTVHYGKAQYRLLDHVCRELMAGQPENGPVIMEVVKRLKDRRGGGGEAELLSGFGYHASDFLESPYRYGFLFGGVGLVLGVSVIGAALWYQHKKELLRIQRLTAYLEGVNAGDMGLLLEIADDEFARLQDEIYKTVTTLYQTRDTAVDARNNFADNLSNIAHQLKTPITAISLSNQMMKTHPSAEYPMQIQRQLKRLSYLEEALLLVSRIDAGTLKLERNSVDVFTVLTLAADNLQELFDLAGVSVDIPEMGEIEIIGDLDWIMEAMMNLMKNCMEHAPKGTAVHGSYEKNPLYVQIRIWDEGQGFLKEDLPHLFERFYRGRDAAEGGIGIGLALAKSILEMQNGLITAMNLPGGGACFEIRIYSH